MKQRSTHITAGACSRENPENCSRTSHGQHVPPSMSRTKLFLNTMLATQCPVSFLNIEQAARGACQQLERLKIVAEVWQCLELQKARGKRAQESCPHCETWLLPGKHKAGFVFQGNIKHGSAATRANRCLWSPRLHCCMS